MTSSEVETMLTAKSSIDRIPKNFGYSPPAANADRDDDRALTARPSLPFLCRSATSRCDKPPSRSRRSQKCAPGRERPSRGKEISEPTVDKRTPGHQVAPRDGHD